MLKSPSPTLCCHSFDVSHGRIQHYVDLLNLATATNEKGNVGRFLTSLGSQKV